MSKMYTVMYEDGGYQLDGVFQYMSDAINWALRQLDGYNGEQVTVAPTIDPDSFASFGCPVFVVVLPSEIVDLHNTRLLVCEHEVR